jgi:hypothetical protein
MERGISRFSLNQTFGTLAWEEAASALDHKEEEWAINVSNLQAALNLPLDLGHESFLGQSV